MRKGSVIVAFLVLASVFHIVLTVVPQNARASTLFVGGMGPGNFTTIKDAVDSALPGDTVFVFNGTYVENIPVYTTVNLVGEDKNTTIIDANSNGNALYLNADWVNVSGFTIANGRIGKAGILIQFANNCLIENNNFVGNDNGVQVAGSHNNSIVTNNMSSNYYHGITVTGSDDNLIRNNIVSFNEKSGIYLGDAHNNTVEDNIIQSNTEEGLSLWQSFGNAVIGNSLVDDEIDSWASANTTIAFNWISNAQAAVVLVRAHNSTVSGNTVRDNIFGLRATESYNLTVSDNDFSRNRVGVTLQQLRNSIFSGNDASFSGQYGYSISGSDHNWFHDNTGSSNNWDGFWLSHSSDNILTNNTVSANRNGIHLTDSHRNILINNTITSNKLDGVLNILSDGNTIIGNTFSQNKFNGTSIGSSECITFTGNVMVGGGVTIRGGNLGEWNTHVIDTSNTVNGKPVYYWKNTTGGNAPVDAGQMIVANSDDVVIENLDASNTSVGIQIGFSSNILIRNNTAKSNTCVGIATELSCNNRITGNIVVSNGLSGIFLYASNGDNVVDNNTATSNGAHGIYLQFSSGNSISTNTVADNYIGLSLKHSDGNTIINNTLSDSEYGIYTFQSYSNVISSNDLLANGVGIFLYAGSSSSITGNTIHWNSYYAIYLWTSRDNRIVDNYISNNGYGAYLYFSSNNAVYHNDFIDNAGQAHDDLSDSVWDDGYPSGGNYWSVYTGLDEKSGPLQNQPGSDGIGDRQYDIDGGVNQDRYPLMNPHGSTPQFSPSAPQNLQAVSGDQQIALTWEAPAFDGNSPITNYRIYQGLTPGGETFLTEIPDVLGYIDTGLTNGQTYYYYVTAVNSIGESLQSNEASSIPASVPGPPRELNAVAGDEEVTFTWSAPSDNGGFAILNYLVYRGTVSGGEIFLTMIGDVNEFIDSGLTNGQEYYYKVSAKNTVGEGPLSNEVMAIPIGPLENQPPTCEITSPSSDDTVFGTYTVTGLAEDPDGTVTLVEIRIDDGGWVQAIGLTSWVYIWNTSNASNGVHTIHAQSYDGANYSTEASVSVTVHNVPPQEPGNGEEPDGGVFWWVAVIILLIVSLIFGAWLVLTLRRRESEGKRNSD